MEGFRTMFVRATRRHLDVSLLWKDEGGAIAVITALALTVLIGVVGLAIDVGMWYQTDRALQNAADAAVIAAATNGTDTYQSEAKAVVAQYGFVDGTNGITVTALNNQTCPSGTTDCYKVTVAQASAPLFFSGVLGLSAPAVSGAAMASSSATHSYCVLALATSGNAIRTNGASSANMNGCSVMSNSGAKCDGTNLRTTPNGPTYGDAAGTNTGCGITEHSNVSPVLTPMCHWLATFLAPPPPVPPTRRRIATAPVCHPLTNCPGPRLGGLQRPTAVICS